MVPIRFRLDDKLKIEYIEKIKTVIGETRMNKMSQRIYVLIRLLQVKGFIEYKELLDYAEVFQDTYPSSKYFCMWILLSVEQMTKLVLFIKSNYINKNIDSINSQLSKRYEPVKSYMDLRLRRKYKYSDIYIANLFKLEHKYDYMYTIFKECINIYDNNFSSKGINYWIIENTDMKVCPYCNLSYTYNRGKNTTAQLDHFFCKAEYPMFALCYYNLIPSCPACNRIKSSKIEELSSPYENNAFENMKITWKFKRIQPNTNGMELKTLEDNIKITITSDELRDNNNITAMKINEAYNQHKDIASEFIKKVQIYMNPQSQKLIKMMCTKWSIKSTDIERFYFGQYLSKEKQGKRVLSKMAGDFMEEYKKNIR